MAWKRSGVQFPLAPQLWCAKLVERIMSLKNPIVLISHQQKTILSNEEMIVNDYFE